MDEKEDVELRKFLEDVFEYIENTDGDYFTIGDLIHAGFPVERVVELSRVFEEKGIMKFDTPTPKRALEAYKLIYNK